MDQEYANILNVFFENQILHFFSFEISHLQSIHFSIFLRQTQLYNTSHHPFSPALVDLPDVRNALVKS